MGDELVTLSSAGAVALGTVMATDAWRGLRAGISAAFRALCRRRDGGSPAWAEATAQEAGSLTGGPAEDPAGRCQQTNVALGGDVFAVQRGDMTVYRTGGASRPGAR
jgi:hypothetical protein